eukprot:1394466-Rhodomonas_salina.4
MGEQGTAMQWRWYAVVTVASVLVLGLVCVGLSESFATGQSSAELDEKMENECDLYGCHTVDVDVKSPAQKTMAKSQDHDVLSKLSKLARALDQAKGAG